jgi:hypothetical protein
VQYPDVYCVCNRGLVFAQKTFGRVSVCEAQAMYEDRPTSSLTLELVGFGAPSEDLHAFWKSEFAGYTRQVVVVAANYEGPNPCAMEAAQLLGQKTRRLHRGLIAVVEIARDNQCIDLFRKAKLDDSYKGAPGGVADQFGELRISKG